MTIESIPGVDLDSILGLKPEPAAPAIDGLSKAISTTVLSADSPAVVMCRDQLPPDLQESTHTAARAILPLLIGNIDGTVPGNIQRLAEVGTPAVAEVNQASDQLFHLFLSGDRVKIPELTGYTKELDKAVRGFSKKHVSDKSKANTDSYEQFKGKLMDWVNRNRDWLRELISDAKGLERRMDGIIATIIEKRGQLVRNVALCNELYAVNERAITKLTLAIATLEYLRDEAGKALSDIVIIPGTPEEHDNRERQQILTDLIPQIEVRISEFKQRLFVAVATSPQIRNIRTLNYGLSQRLGMIIDLTIPVFKLTVVQWAMAIEAQQGAEMTEAAADFNNATLLAWAQAGKEMVPAMAKVIQTPSTDPSTILAVADSLIAQFEGFDQAYLSGVQQRRTVDAAITQGQLAIAVASDKRADVLKQLIIAGNTPVELPAAPELPAVIRDNAVKALAMSSS